MSSYFENWW